MTAGQDWTQVLVNILTVVTGPAVLGYFVTQLVKRHRGKLTRAKQETVDSRRKDLLYQKVTNYAQDLREDLIAAGVKPKPWPPGTRPKD